MKCPQCGHENLAGTKFCGECGRSLAARCATCGAANPPTNKFCGECGGPLAHSATAPKFATPETYTPKHLAEKILTSKAALEGERKQVTVLFADLKGSMELLADRDPEEARKLLDPVLQRMMEAVHRYEGTVNQVMGDGIMALFGAPVAHEDHAVRACYAALDMQATIRRYADEARRAHGVAIEIRIGLNSGEVVVRAIGSDLHMDYTAVGQTTHLAARMEQLATGGRSLLTADTLRLAEGYVEVKPLGPVPVKGVQAPIDVYDLVGAGPLRSRLHAAATRGLTRFVGRERELEQIRESLGQAASGHGQVVAVVGEPGVGKSRLIWEVTQSRRIHGWLILQARSVSYGRATPYLPVIDLLKGYFHIEDRDDARTIREKVIGKLLTLDEALRPTLPIFLSLLDVPIDEAAGQALDWPQRRQQTLEAIKRLLLRESQVQPVLVVFEDLHWIDSETQALLDRVVESVPTARVLLLVNYRPEYEHRWGSKTYYTQLRLDALPPDSAHELLQALLGDDPDLLPLKQRLIERTEGNPFFVEESVRTLVETGILAGARGAYRVAKPVETVQVPATVHAVLAARIDRLPLDDKRLLQAASVIGKDVPLTLLKAIAELPEDALHHSLGHLHAAEFLYETRLVPEPEYTFKHALTHEVSYGSLLHERRRTLHRQVGDAIEGLRAERAEEWYGPLAHHFIESGDLAKGLHYALRAGDRAARLFAHEEALRAYERARACAEGLNLPEQGAVADEAMGDVQQRRGMYPLAVAAYQRALVHVVRRERRALLTFKIGRAYAYGDPRGVEFLHAALKDLDPITQVIEVAQATAMIGRYHHYLGQHAQTVALLEQARQLAEPLDDPETLLRIYGWLSGACYNLARLDEALSWARQCLSLGERTDNPHAVALGYEYLAECLCLQGRWDESLTYSAREEQVAERIGQQDRLAWSHRNRAWALHGRGDLASALETARIALSLTEVTGERRLATLVRALLAQIQIDLAQDEAALAGAQAAIIGADELGDRAVRGFTRNALAYVYTQRESWELAAEQFARILEGTDSRLMSLVNGALAAYVAWQQGRTEEATNTIEATLELARTANSPHYEAIALRIQGEMLIEQGRWSEALRTLDDAVGILDRLGSRLELGRGLYARGITLKGQGNVVAARADVERAREIFVETAARRDLDRATKCLQGMSD
jgi:class 3 adenylate cyclase/tetratricopeptide (TPR) repeat protein